MLADIVKETCDIIEYQKDVMQELYTEIMLIKESYPDNEHVQRAETILLDALYES